MVLGVELPFDLVHEVEERVLLFRGGFEPSRDESTWDDERVALADGEAIKQGKRELVRCDPFRWIAFEEWRARHAGIVAWGGSERRRRWSRGKSLAERARPAGGGVAAAGGSAIARK